MEEPCIAFDKYGYDLNQLTPEEKNEEIKKLRFQVEKYKDVICSLRHDVHTLRGEMVRSKKEAKALLKHKQENEGG